MFRYKIKEYKEGSDNQNCGKICHSRRDVRMQIKSCDHWVLINNQLCPALYWYSTNGHSCMELAASKKMPAKYDAYIPSNKQPRWDFIRTVANSPKRKISQMVDIKG